MLIGLLALACPPRDKKAWFAWWQEPPTPEQLDAAFAPYAPAFALDGDGPHFMQDRENLSGESNTPETLLIEAPGEATRRDNAALLNKPDRVRTLSRAAAAMALFTLQTYAPAGGRGNLTSVRGGGPLTTLVLPGRAQCGRSATLWHTLWANVPFGKPVPLADLPLVLPWLAPTRTADRFPATTPADSHPLQAFWGMPRRIRLDFAPNTECLPCDLTGVVDDIIVKGWRQRPNGVKYVAFEHPLSPYYKNAKGGWLPVHPQPGGVGYRHWTGLALEGGETTGRKPAACVSDWRRRARDVADPVRAGVRLLVGGYDMDNMKARSFFESEMPLPGAGDPAIERQIEPLARGLVMAADITARALRQAIRDAALDGAPLATAYEGMWTATQEPFFDALHRNAEAPPGDDSGAALRREAGPWQDRLRCTALSLFDEAAPLDPSSASFDYERIVAARRGLLFTLKGYGPLGYQLASALGLAVPEPSRSTASSGEPPMNTDAHIAADWWRSLQSHRPAGARNPAGGRAALGCLRRADLIAAMDEPVTFDLFRALGRTTATQLTDVALCAAVLATVREDDRPHPARALGPKPGGKIATAMMSPFRFRRLVEVTIPEDRLIALRRAVMLAGCRLSVQGLAHACLDWSDATRRTWIFQYYNAGDAAPDLEPMVAEETNA